MAKTIMTQPALYMMEDTKKIVAAGLEAAVEHVNDYVKQLSLQGDSFASKVKRSARVFASQTHIMQCRAKSLSPLKLRIKRFV